MYASPPPPPAEVTDAWYMASSLLHCMSPPLPQLKWPMPGIWLHLCCTVCLHLSPAKVTDAWYMAPSYLQCMPPPPLPQLKWLMPGIWLHLCCTVCLHLFPSWSDRCLVYGFIFVALYVSTPSPAEVTDAWYMAPYIYFIWSNILNIKYIYSTWI